MRLRKITALLCTAVMSLSMLTGCGSSPDTSKNEGSKKEEAKNEESSGTYDKQALENAGEITLTMMVSGTEVENDFDTVVLPRLVKEKWPNITLEVTKLPDDNYYTALKTKLASGECPDIILVQPMYAGSNSVYALAEAGYLADLSDLDCLSQYSDVTGMTYEDKVYAIPDGVSMLGTFYNKDMFEECGITEAPKTWDEFLDACEKIKTKGYTPIVMGDKDQFVLQFGLYQIAANEIYAKNPDYDQQLRDGDAKFTDKGTWDKVLEKYKELYDKKYIDASQSLGTGASQAIQEFIDGNAAMTFDGSFNVTALLANGAGGEFERGYFPIPGDDKENVYTATCLSSGRAVYSGSKYINESKQIIDLWHDGQSDIWDEFVATGRYTMTFGEGAENAPNYELFRPFIDLMNDGKAFHWCNQAWPAGTEGTMQELFSEMIGGQGTTIEDITQGMQDKFEDLLDE